MGETCSCKQVSGVTLYATTLYTDVEDVEHLVMRCAHVIEERGKLMELMDERVEGWLSMEENERVAVAMDKACTDPAVGRAMERLWRKRFT